MICAIKVSIFERSTGMLSSAIEGLSKRQKDELIAALQSSENPRIVLFVEARVKGNDPSFTLRIDDNVKGI